ncbi:hypothetical protein VB005_02861 [Metarhizium brunneum]
MKVTFVMIQLLAAMGFASPVPEEEPTRVKRLQWCNQFGGCKPEPSASS